MDRSFDEPLPYGAADNPHTNDGVLDAAVDGERRRGRGAATTASRHYEPHAKVAFDDGWQSLEELPPFKTYVTEERARKIISRNESPDIGFDRSFTAHHGCAPA